MEEKAAQAEQGIDVEEDEAGIKVTLPFPINQFHANKYLKE